LAYPAMLRMLLISLRIVVIWAAVILLPVVSPDGVVWVVFT